MCAEYSIIKHVGRDMHAPNSACLKFVFYEFYFMFSILGLSNMPIFLYFPATLHSLKNN